MTPSDQKHFEDRLLEQLRGVVAAAPAPSASPRPRPGIRIALAGGCATAVAAVAVVAGAGSGGSTPKAYAIEAQADGVVVVSIDSTVSLGEEGEDSLEYSRKLNALSPSDAAGLQSGLEEAGVPAVVNFAPTGERGCLEPQEAAPPGAATNHGSIGWDGLGKFWADLRREGGVAWAELPPFPAAVSAGRDLYETLADERHSGESPGIVARDGRGVTIQIDPSRIGPGEKLFILASDGTMETVTLSISSEPPLPDCPAP